MSRKKLGNAILRILRRQGYSVRDGLIALPENPSKDLFRRLNELAANKKREIAKVHLKQQEHTLIEYIANGNEVIPDEICPRLVLVKKNSEDELLFRYACAHWSIPVSTGYGRRLRFLVMDESNDKLIGLFGLGDPVYSMRSRDEWIQWNGNAKKDRLYHVMDAYVLGSVPPYSSLLCGKLVAMLSLSNEVRDEFRKKYGGKKTLISEQVRPPYLTLITTTSALGRSSVYNRIRINGFDYWQSVGFTSGWGDFHFSNGVYSSVYTYAKRWCEPTAKNEAWGNGFRNKREVVRKCLSKIGLSTDLACHGIKREIFAAPLGRETLRFLRGEVSRPCFYDWPAADLSEAFKNRWLLARAERMPEFVDFRREQYCLWTMNSHRRKK